MLICSNTTSTTQPWTCPQLGLDRGRKAARAAAAPTRGRRAHGAQQLTSTRVAPPSLGTPPITARVPPPRWCLLLRVMRCLLLPETASDWSANSTETWGGNFRQITRKMMNLNWKNPREIWGTINTMKVFDTTENADRMHCLMNHHRKTTGNTATQVKRLLNRLL